MIEAIIAIIIAVALLYVSISTLQRYSQITKNGQETEGIVFDINSSDNLDTATVHYPVVRFITINQQWITEKSLVSIIPGSYKKGQKITVVYRIENPSDFFIKSNNTHRVLIATAVIAIILLVIGIYLFITPYMVLEILLIQIPIHHRT